MTIQTMGMRGAWLATAALGATDWLRLAATPTFAMMALVVGAYGGSPQGMLCMAAQSRSPLSGMVWMYVLMSVFHSAAWLKLFLGSHNSTRSS